MGKFIIYNRLYLLFINKFKPDYGLHSCARSNPPHPHYWKTNERERERKVKINMYKSLMDVRPTLAATLKCVLDIIGLR